MSKRNNGGIFMSCYSFTKILNAVDPSDDIIDFLIRTHHKYLMVKNAEYKNAIVIPVDNYDGFSRMDSILYVYMLYYNFWNHNTSFKIRG